MAASSRVVPTLDDHVSAACLEYLNLTLSSLLAEIGGEGLLPAPFEGGMPLQSISSSSDESSIISLLPTPLDYSETTPVSEGVIRTSVNGGGVMMCLASVLEALSDCDERCVFSVRKINKLGFKSHSALKKYFAQFGTVVAIFFLPYRYKPDTSSVRPSSMAFVRMASRFSVDAIFANGTTHCIHGWPVSVQTFSRSPTASFMQD